ncbi:unnamed protein product [Eruca vesicaria subsp. sativa]|uniref:Ureidoglycolate hydrolase n=1 Tax=Eruca vesicaria subsp. sativa TaxID=29727 RepID=A0ABC8LUR7_ERUVS|nr:unnamed protein product [Eruca vesicaria subsp. sativa]
MNSNISGHSPFANSSSSSSSSEFDEWLKDEIEAMEIEERILINVIAQNNYLIHHLIQQNDQATMAESPEQVNLIPIEATSESFADYGQVIEASSDGDHFGPNDAQLDLSRGIPRFYIMRLKDRSFGFSTITHHANVTQCLGSIGGHVWYLGVAKPSLIEDVDRERVVGGNVESGSNGHLYALPAVEDVRVFRFSGPKFVKLNRGTWHAGPLFSESSMDFYNLELSNTNEVDHTTHDFKKKNGIIFRFN